MGPVAKQYIGVDITANAVRVVGIGAGKKPVFLGCKELVMETDALTKNGVADSQKLGNIVRAALQGSVPHPIKTGPAYTAVQESHIFRKVMELPSFKNEEELAGALRVQASNFLPQDVSESEIDFQYLGPVEDGTAQQIMLVAVPSNVVRQYVEVFKQAALPLRAVDVRSAALARGTVPAGEKKAIVIVSPEKELAGISLYQGGLIRVTSSITMRNDPEMEDDDRVRELTVALVDEIDHVVKFYNNRTPEHAEVKEVRLIVTEPWAGELKKRLADELDMSVTLAKPAIEVPAFCDGRFLAALGCALYPLQQ